MDENHSISLIGAINGILAIGDDDYVRRTIFDTYEVIESEVIDTLRWSVVRRDVVTDGNQFVELTYCEPATEYQDVDLNMSARRVYPETRTVTVYV